MESKGSKVTWVLPSRDGVFSSDRTLPSVISDKPFANSAVYMPPPSIHYSCGRIGNLGVLNFRGYLLAGSAGFFRNEWLRLQAQTVVSRLARSTAAPILKKKRFPPNLL